MKTIEEKACSHVDKIFSEIIDKYQTAPWNEFRDALAQIFLVGAKEALAGQWRKDDDIEGLQDGEQVIVAIQRIDNSIKYFFAAYFHSGKFWYDSDDTEIYSFNLWMRLPEPPKDECHV
ncbi:MAG: hypothetical protein K2G77_08685 [Muribaculaceae bacterium]|nr:hypothetical protein [Muribaculaceae bacterium]